jgi:solute carrier family 6 amino acid transporter-like protein 5/7/9/14
LVDYFGATFAIFLTAALEVVGIMWFYGINNFVKDIEFMLDLKIGWYWKICWGIVIPVGLTIILVHSLIVTDPLSYNDVRYPTSALGMSIARTHF